MHPSKASPGTAGRNGYFICKFNTISSTQDEMKKILRQNVTVPPFSVIAAAVQTRGKGRMGRKWDAEKDKNALFSFVTYPGLPPSDAFVLYQWAAVAVAESLREYAGVDAVIKYPNDILVNGKKIAGILIDNLIGDNKIKYAVTGIGLNVNQKEFPEHLHATSLVNETGKMTPPDIWIERIISTYKKYLESGSREIFRQYVYLWDRAGAKKGIIFQNRPVAGEITAMKNDLIYIRTGRDIREFPVRQSHAWI